jgi:phosphoribosylformylglycinamidine synthase subunit PurS
MNFLAEIKIMPLKELLDPQGKAVMGGLSNLGLKNIEDVRIGKHIQLNIEAGNAAEAQQIAEDASKKLLANSVMEEYSIQIS